MSSYASKKWTEDLVGQALKTAKQQGLFGGGSSGIIYSTTEQETNDTWIDGKKIYRMVVMDTVPTTETIGTTVNKMISLGEQLDRVDTMIKMEAFVSIDGMTYAPLPNLSFTIRDTDKIAGVLALYEKPSNIIRLYNSLPDRSGKSVYFVLEYTKAEYFDKFIFNSERNTNDLESIGWKPANFYGSFSNIKTQNELSIITTGDGGADTSLYYGAYFYKLIDLTKLKTLKLKFYFSGIGASNKYNEGMQLFVCPYNPFDSYNAANRFYPDVNSTPNNQRYLVDDGQTYWSGCFKLINDNTYEVSIDVSDLSGVYYHGCKPGRNCRTGAKFTILQWTMEK